MRALAIIVTLALTARAEFEDLSTAEIENLLNRLEDEDHYDVEDDEDAGGNRDYYYDYELPQEQRREAEMLLHGMPTSLSQHPPHLNAGPKPGTTKTSSTGVLPAYCDPPNPCPIGYTEKDGCIEDGFENTSDFSRKYQVRLNTLSIL